MSGHPTSSASPLQYHAHAKINFYLSVIDRRTDGYHDIETIFQSIDLADEVTLTPRDGEPALSCTNPALEIPDNLALRAARILRERYAPGRGVHISLAKRIPIAAGLAGGSADAAAVLTGLNEMWGLGLSVETLRAIGVELGSDVPFVLTGGTMSATGRGEVLRPLEPLRETWLVLLHPPMEVSAARVYNHVMLKKTREERIDGTTKTFRNTLETLSRGLLPDVLHNAMEIPVFSEYPQLAVWKQRLLDAGCAGAAMSGSGPTLYGLCKDEAHAKAIAARFTEVASSVVRTIPHGVRRVG